jgi:hypothetical protein
MRTIEQTVFKFSELTDNAKEKAREWWRADYDIHLDHVIDDAATVAALFGLDIGKTNVRLMNGRTRAEPAVYWSGFWSQGDGASFDGDYAYCKGALDAVKSYAPQDADLHTIVRRLQRVQARNFYRLTAGVYKSNHHYCHEMTMRFDVSRTDYARVSDDDAEELSDCLRDFARWIYRALETEWEYQASDESIDELMECNGYEFDEDGRIV